ncbi:site-specific integrase [Halomonas sp. M4R5S39]|uniref:Site-specific integrase n=1 Tax=Halomonas kalidii TaxID=3043293 RepID=A0ABT6VL10_9GAMM|nr:site-specific integrase [Halomonas kalidii]MDI5934658.1 site-specific integrase [Halomonas kalidii]MDI5986002.1 site-specific integrase [Halomonas kalidii]
MSFSIKESKFGNETRVKLLLQDSVPVYWPCLYVIKKMRVRSPNTQQRFLSDLVVFLTWLKLESIELEARLQKRPQSHYLSESELARFTSQVHWKKETIDKLFSGVRLHHAAYQQVGASQAESRMITAKNYLSFLYEALGHPDDRLDQIARMVKRVDLSIKESRPSWKRRPMEPKGLTLEQEDVLLNKLHPGSKDNPWPKSEKIRVRNYLIIMLLFNLGIRRSEMLGIKLADIDFRKNRVQIIHRPNDPDDPRVSEPLVKTNERSLPVREELMAVINKYINMRRGFRRAKTHPYLILAHGKSGGAPLSIKSVDAVFNIAKKAFPVLKGITPHTLRHHDVHQTIKVVSEQTKDLPIEDRMQQEKRILNYKYGWSDTSKMPSLYGQKQYQEQAEKALEARNDKLFSNSSSRDKEDVR